MEKLLEDSIRPDFTFFLLNNSPCLTAFQVKVYLLLWFCTVGSCVLKLIFIKKRNVWCLFSCFCTGSQLWEQVLLRKFLERENVVWARSAPAAQTMWLAEERRRFPPGLLWMAAHIKIMEKLQPRCDQAVYCRGCVYLWNHVYDPFCAAYSN